jgi:hypothetical protein
MKRKDGKGDAKATAIERAKLGEQWEGDRDMI